MSAGTSPEPRHEIGVNCGPSSVQQTVAGRKRVSSGLVAEIARERGQHKRQIGTATGRRAVRAPRARTPRKSPWSTPDCPAGRRRTCRAARPNTSGWPGWISTRSKKNSAPRSPSTRSTRSYLPAETPPEISSRSAVQPALDQPARVVVLVFRHRQNHGDAARPRHLRGQRITRSNCESGTHAASR